MKDSAESQKFTVSVHDHINEIKSDEWNELVHNKMFHTHAWMQLMESSAQESAIPSYITVDHKGHLVGAGVCFFSVRNMWGVRVPSLICTFPLTEKMVLFVKEKKDYHAVFSLLCDALEQVTADKRAWATFITCVPEGSTGDFLKKRGFSLFNQIPNTYLDVQWETFKDYLGSLPRKAKKNIRHTLNQGKKKGLRLEHSHDFSDADRLFDLFKDSLERHRHELLIPCTVEFFRNLEKFVPEHAHIVRCYREEDLLGYWLYFCDGTSAMMAVSGVDQECAREYNTYFNICYDAVREMIEKGCKRVWFGITTYGVKRRIGCDLFPVITAVKARNPLMNLLAHPLSVVWNIRMNRKVSGLE